MEESLRKAVESRGTTYVNREALVFCYEDDDTHAYKDAYAQKACLEDTFGINTSLLQISKNDKFPALTIRQELNDVLKRLPPPSLLILGYAGHGAVDDATGMVKFLSANGRQNVQWKFIAQQWFSDDQSLENIDSFAILDCCFASAVRSRHSRTSQVLAACDTHETARSRSAKFISFSQRFSRACRSLLSHRRPITTVDAIYDEICRQRPADAPSPRIEYLGSSGRIIALPFQTSANPTPPPRPSMTLPFAEYEILTKIRVRGEPNEDAKRISDKFQQTLQELPSQYMIDVVAAYESTSVLFLVRMSHFAFARLSSTTPLEVVGTIKGQSLISRTTTRRGVTNENAPPSIGKPLR